MTPGEQQERVRSSFARQGLMATLGATLDGVSIGAERTSQKQANVAIEPKRTSYCNAAPLCCTACIAKQLAPLKASSISLYRHTPRRGRIGRRVV